MKFLPPTILGPAIGYVASPLLFLALAPVVGGR